MKYVVVQGNDALAKLGSRDDTWFVSLLIPCTLAKTSTNPAPFPVALIGQESFAFLRPVRHGSSRATNGRIPRNSSTMVRLFSPISHTGRQVADDHPYAIFLCLQSKASTSTGPTPHQRRRSKIGTSLPCRFASPLPCSPAVLPLLGLGRSMLNLSLIDVFL
jgi:hypothetical protein